MDGVEIVASLVLLADRRAGRRSGWLPWTALIIGTAASLAANIATADPGTISRIIAGWPAVALLIAVKLLSGILEHPEPATRQPAANSYRKHGKHPPPPPPRAFAATRPNPPPICSPPPAPPGTTSTATAGCQPATPSPSGCARTATTSATPASPRSCPPSEPK